MRNSKYYPWVVVGLLWFVALLNYLDRQMLSTMQSSMQMDIRELAIAENFGRIMGIFLLIYGLMSPIAGIIADRVNRKWLIVGSLFVWSAVTWGMGYAETYSQVYWLRALMGVSEALYLPTGLAMIADFHSSKTRSLAIGIHMSGLYTGQALGGFGATIAANYSWQTVFHWFGIVGIIYSVLLIFILFDKEGHAGTKTSRLNVDPQKTPVKKASVLSSFGLILGTLSFWIMLFYFMAPSFPGWATKNWLPTLFSENLGVEMAKAGPMATISIAIASFFGVLIGGPLSDKWVQKNIRGRIYTSVIGLTLTIPSLILLGYGHSYVGLIGAAVLFGIGFGMFDTNNMPILCQIIPQKLRATAYGIMNMMGVFAGYIVTLMLGSSTDAGNLGADFSKLSIVVLVAVILMLIFVKPKPELTYNQEN
ncbi:MAG TPA: MFS transporter [Fermentimonas caenicola]|jgi:MFS family permease|uniref:Transporter, major facilitator family protein n=1 Tax=Fermentimonas caenicola TaxID=1562970 RepID=A0A098C2G8_9BACT|nr:MFS transporter [Fermentimonas sp.]TAH62482.1 MAG: MFS transporter [Fermentimonas caenicola]CEA17100.1 transporter, major facilitator family protein [Fermentimonas caenicola]HHU42155.1 MFS transporter [Fermentimonas caenicola]